MGLPSHHPLFMGCSIGKPSIHYYWATPIFRAGNHHFLGWESPGKPTEAWLRWVFSWTKGEREPTAPGWTTFRPWNLFSYIRLHLYIRLHGFFKLKSRSWRWSRSQIVLETSNWLRETSAGKPLFLVLILRLGRWKRWWSTTSQVGSASGCKPIKAYSLVDVNSLRTGKSTIPRAIFNSELLDYQGVKPTVTLV